MNILRLDYDQIFKDYPLSVKRVEDWFLETEEIRFGLKNIGADISKEEVLTGVVRMVISADPRKLYDTFDGLGIYISVYYTPKLSEADRYCRYEVSGVPPNYSTGGGKERVDAELQAFFAAFHLLESQLRNQPTK